MSEFALPLPIGADGDSGGKGAGADDEEDAGADDVSSAVLLLVDFAGMLAVGLLGGGEYAEELDGTGGIIMAVFRPFTGRFAELSISVAW